MVAFSTPTQAPRWQRWMLYSPLARILFFALVMAGLLFAISVATAAAGWSAREAPVLLRRATFFAKQLVPALSAYLLLVYLVERRRPVELAWRKVAPHGLTGAAVGTVLICATVAVLWLLGSYRVVATNPGVNWLAPLFLAGIGTAVAEEIVFRGVLFRITEEGLGTWPALAVSALLFGALHLFNTGATLWSTFAIAVEAGLLLALAYHLSRSLPLCIGIHMAWNFVEGTVFGIPVSGTPEPGWLVSTRPGPAWLTGGTFGVEASPVAVALSLLVSMAMILRIRRRASAVVRRWPSRRIMTGTSRENAAC
jgi:hypothetical protein